MFVDVVVLIVFFKSVTRLQNGSLCGKGVTTLVSASCKRSASAGGFHSCAKSVHFASLSFLGLIGSFHFKSPYSDAFRRGIAIWAATASAICHTAYFHYNVYYILANTVFKVKCFSLGHSVIYAALVTQICRFQHALRENFYSDAKVFEETPLLPPQKVVTSEPLTIQNIPPLARIVAWWEGRIHFFSCKLACKIPGNY